MFSYLLTRHCVATANKTASKQERIFGEKPQRRTTPCQIFHHPAQMLSHNLQCIPLSLNRRV